MPPRAAPLPWVGCRHHLGLDVNTSGTLKHNTPPAGEGAGETCALDVAERGGLAREEVGTILGISVEAVRIIELAAFDKLARQIDADDWP